MERDIRGLLFKWLGVELSPVSHIERLVSVAGGFAGIYMILVVSRFYLDGESAALLVASMGATAVLLFAVPHGPLSQPWPVIAGHLVSAVVGVSCARYIPDTALAAALAVALAIGAMHYLRCIHPPGGATALSAVMGGASVQELGYQFVLTPVLLNVLIIFFVAVLFNLPFPWRRYPAQLKKTLAKDQLHYPSISHEDLVFALSEVDSFIDISEQDLLAIYSLATLRSQRSLISPEQLQLGRYFSNGRYGNEWCVRQIVDAAGNHAEDDMLIFKVMAGAGLRSSGVATREEFAAWAKYEVYRDDENWRRVEDEGEKDGGNVH